MEPLIEGEKFARKCSVTGEGMDQGYVVQDGEIYFKYKNDLVRHLRELDWEDCNGNRSQNIKHDGDLMDFFHNEEYYYWTSWDGYVDYEYVVKNGVLVEIEE
jgi:hypothetical protein